MLIECWRRGSHDWTTVINSKTQITNTIEECQRLCQQTNSPDCEYFTYHPLNKKCWVQKASANYNTIKVHDESAKAYLTGTKRCQNGNYQHNNLRFC